MIYYPSIFLIGGFMFKHRSDGVFEKTADPILGATSFIMPHRYDAMVNFLLVSRCENLDQYIKKTYEEKGIHLSYMEVLIAAIVRMYAKKPFLNRFVMNGRIYRRDAIYISFTVKKQLIEDAPETTVKLKFTGEEDIFAIKKMIDDEIIANKGNSKNDTDKTAKILSKIPNWLLKIGIGIIKWMDKHNCLPKKLIELSPFHTSCFLTNMKSISTDYVYHHLYDFGTTSMFVGLGKEHLEPVVNDVTSQLEVGKVQRTGVVIDERICDGFYYAKSIKYIRTILQNPAQLEEVYKIPERDKVYSKKQLRAKKKARKAEKKRLLKMQKLIAKQNTNN